MLRRFAAPPGLGEGVPQGRDFFPVASGHRWVQERSGLFAALGNHFFQNLQSGSDTFQLVFDQRGGDAVPDGLQDVRTRLLEPLQRLGRAVRVLFRAPPLASRPPRPFRRATPRTPEAARRGPPRP